MAGKRKKKKSSPDVENQKGESTETRPQQINWFGRHPFTSSMLTALLLWCSMPPLATWTLKDVNSNWTAFPIFSLFAWVALFPLLGIVFSKDLPNKSYRKIWIAAWIYSAATLYFIPIPHPAMWIGWFLLSFYVSLYLPLFVLVSRTLIHRLRCPALVAIPVAWVGLEYFRTTFLTGFGLTLLGHSQFRIPVLIQISDLFGAYTVSLVIAFVATCLAAFVWRTQWNLRFSHIGMIGLAIAGTVAYGRFRLVEGEIVRENQPRLLNVALLQGNIDTVFPKNENELLELEEFKIDHYRELASSASLWQRRGDLYEPSVDLLIWPEGKFPAPDWLVEPGQFVPEIELKDYENMRKQFDFALEWMQSVERSTKDPPDMKLNPVAIDSIVGTQSYNPALSAQYNSAILLDSKGEIQSRYHKIHRVIVGEYIPFANIFPALASLSPNGVGLTPGPGASALEFEDFVFCPNICFESCVPHFIRSQVNQLSRNGLEPDFIVNLSDDGWFYGTSCLDFHLANTVFRAVELRKPTLAAANTGLSANIDGCGNIINLGPRRKSELMFVIAKPDGRSSLYRIIGDWPVFGMMLICLFSLAVALKLRWSKPGTIPT